MNKVSPLSPKNFLHLPPISGVRLAACAAGIRYQNRTDLLLITMPAGTAAAGVFTRSLTASAPVEWCRAAVAGGVARALVVNSGNSNAFTGKAGIASVQRTVDATAGLLGCAADAVYVASTGVIGEILPDERIMAALPNLAASVREDAWADAARAIMTTDSFPKMATRTAHVNGVEVRINGIAKGSGMIAPDMATMLAFIFTDAAISAELLQEMLRDVNEKTFNCITVDSDTSTSDTALLFATGTAGNTPPTRAEAEDFRCALHEVMTELAQLIVRDGEGAQKLVTITVTGAEHDTAARRIALSIANSPLVKTAIAGEDANWGRIVMAVGKAGERADRDRLSIRIGGVEVARNGAVVAGYDETPVVAHMKTRDINVEVDVGVGQGTARVWTCDLTHGYIDINGSYRS